MSLENSFETPKPDSSRERFQPTTQAPVPKEEDLEARRVAEERQNKEFAEKEAADQQRIAELREQLRTIAGGSGENEGQSRPDLNNMPLEDPEQYFSWLKEYHSYTNYEVQNTEGITEDVVPYNYDHLPMESVRKAFEAVKKQRADDPENMKKLLADLTPAQIILLASEPDRKLYTKEEESIIRDETTGFERQRISNLPGFQEVVQPNESVKRYVHDTEHQKTAETTMSSGLFADERTGLSTTATALGQDKERSLDRLATRHQGYDYTVVVGLPSLNQSLLEQFRKLRGQGVVVGGPESLFTQKAKGEVAQGGEQTYDALIPAEFVEGYLDAKTGEFKKNPNYWETKLTSESERLEKIAEFNTRAASRLEELKAQFG